MKHNYCCRRCFRKHNKSTKIIIVVIIKVNRWKVVSLPPRSRRFCDVRYNTSRGGRSERERERGVALGRNAITYWLHVFYMIVSTDRDAFGFPPPLVNLPFTILFYIPWLSLSSLVLFCYYDYYCNPYIETKQRFCLLLCL